MFFIKFKKLKSKNYSIIVCEKNSKKELQKVGTYLRKKKIIYVFLNTKILYFWLHNGGAHVDTSVMFYLEVLLKRTINSLIKKMKSE